MSVVRAASIACLVFAACASDAAQEPVAEVDTPGAFIAVDENLGYLKLYRALDVFDSGGERLVVVSVYAVQPHSFDEARELAKDPNLVVGIEADFVGRNAMMAVPHEVVWFRTLTREEIARVP